MTPREADALRAAAAVDCDDPTADQLAALEAAQSTITAVLDRHDRAQGRKSEQKARLKEGRKRRTEGEWKLPAARRIVRLRSGGACELAGPECIAATDRHREVHHVYGRLGADPHHPSKLLGVCGHGNADGCHGWAHSTAEGREAARERAAGIASAVSS